MENYQQLCPSSWTSYDLIEDFGQGFANSSSQKQVIKKEKVQKEKLGTHAEIEFDDELLPIEVFLVDTARKRDPRVEGRVVIQDIQNSEPREKPQKIQNSSCKPERNGTRPARALREIFRREGLGPLNYEAPAEKIEVPLNLLEFFQASPDAAKEFRKLSQRVNTRTKKKELKGMNRSGKVAIDGAVFKIGSSRGI